MRSILALFIICLVNAQALDIGAKAPGLDGVTWVRGEAPAMLGDRWVVVEFWATWCGPCRISIPHLTSLQAQYADQVSIVGLSDEPKGVVQPFVDEQGDQMAYNVGLAPQALKTAYTEGIPGIPYAFLVDPTGTVAWRGHPMEIDPILEQAVAGTLDIEALKRLAPLQAAFEQALQSRNVLQIDSSAKALLAVDPWNQQAIQMLLRVAQYQDDPAAHRAVLDGLAIDEMPAGLANALAWQLITDESLGWRDLEKALAISAHAVAVASDNAAFADTRARCLYLVGDFAGAIAEQERALALSPNDPGLQANLSYYQRARALGRSGGDAPPAPAVDASSQNDPVDLP